ncbi:MAG TPA: hypothetical protein QF509_07960 [Rhodospirillales bacterium]|nr:hypothetical protein [Rhodospirillales bacterium]
MDFREFADRNRPGDLSRPCVRGDPDVELQGFQIRHARRRHHMEMAFLEFDRQGEVTPARLDFARRRQVVGDRGPALGQEPGEHMLRTEAFTGGVLKKDFGTLFFVFITIDRLRGQLQVAAIVIIVVGLEADMVKRKVEFAAALPVAHFSIPVPAVDGVVSGLLPKRLR